MASSVVRGNATVNDRCRPHQATTLAPSNISARLDIDRPIGLVHIGNATAAQARNVRLFQHLRDLAVLADGLRPERGGCCLALCDTAITHVRPALQPDGPAGDDGDDAHSAAARATDGDVDGEHAGEEVGLAETAGSRIGGLGHLAGAGVVGEAERELLAGAGTTDGGMMRARR
jgi:hypothetical protein